MSELTSARFAAAAPLGWRRTSIGDAMSPISRPIAMQNDETYRLVSIRRGHGGFFDRERLPGRRILTKTLERLEPGAFVLARMQIVHGACALVPAEMADGAVSKSYVQLVGTTLCDTRFFARLAQTPEMMTLYRDASQGVVIEKMTFDLRRWLGSEINLPPLAEQQRIAEILDTVDDAIRRTEEIIAKLKQVKQGLLHDLLTRGIDDNGELRDPVRHPEQFKDSELGRIPKTWTVRTVGSLLALDAEPAMRSGPFGSALLKHELVDKGVPLLGIDNVHTDRFDSNYRRFVTPAKAASLARYFVRPRDVMITIMGTVGRCCVVPDIGPALSSKHVWTLTFNEDQYLPELVALQVNHSPWVLAHFRRDEQGGIMASIRSETLRSAALPCPPLVEQLAIGARLAAIDHEIGANIASASQFGMLKEGLMNDLLTGRVRTQHYAR